VPVPGGCHIFSWENDPDDYRSCFQCDRDRIIYSKAFKEVQYKTQIFLIGEGDFYRTRLAHTLEVAQHARTFGRCLRLIEDLCDAISYAHDLEPHPIRACGRGHTQRDSERQWRLFAR
jgi:dGTPase